MGTVTGMTDEERFWSKVNKHPGGCWLWTAGCRPTGYGHFSLKGVGVSASRHAFTLSHGNIPKGHVVRHTCDTRLCVNPDHLIVGTQKDNMDDMLARGRGCKGEDSPQSDLMEKDVVIILERLARGEKGVDIARDFGVTPANVTAIRHGRTWKHLERPVGIRVSPGYLLTEGVVKEIEAGLAQGKSMSGLAVRYGVSITAIRSIRDGKNRYSSGRSGGLDGHAHM